MARRLMRVRRQPAFQPPLRFLAAITLFFWIGAIALCRAHCTFGIGHGGDSRQASCHGAPARGGRDAGNFPVPTNHESSPSLVCLTLKAVLYTSQTSPLIHPDFPLLYKLAPCPPAFDAPVAEPTTPVFRQAQTWHWVFRPEVCLGPAFRGLAPPPSFPLT